MNARLHRNTAYFMSAQLLNRGAYAALLVTLTFLFGIGSVTDIFFVAITIPVMIVNITMDGCFVTVLRALSKTVSEDEQWAVIGQSLVLFAVVYLVIAAIIGIFAPELVRVTAPGLGLNSRRQAIGLLAFAASMIPAQGIGQVVSSTLIHRERVAAGAWRPAIVSILSLVTAFGGAAAFGASIQVFLSGMVLGVWIVNLGYLIWLLRGKKGFALHLRFSADIAQIFWSGLVNSGNNVPTNIALLVERAVATLLGPGALSAINLARTCLNLVGAPAAAAANSTFVEAMMIPGSSSGHELRRRRTGMLYGPLFIATPILALLAIESPIVVRLLFEHGRANAVSADVVAHVLLILVASFPFLICSTGLLRLYQSAYIEKLHLGILCAGTAVYALVAILFGKSMQIGELAAVYVVCFNMTAFTLAVVAAHRLGREVIAIPWIRWGIASIASLGILMVRGLFSPFSSAVVELLVDGAMAAAAYAVVGWVIDLPGIRSAIALSFRIVGLRAREKAVGEAK